ncbi:hypothetical protein E2C01_068243 [Portunus trituberculatus]|uniref:Uncharacterized protein n=1 Tax=Portunus trituberculatus TaxID=210409 RepID=A0A5B7HLY7_PORTR|nr:hypothetical protein [Portunus trituberculatus]
MAERRVQCIVLVQVSCEASSWNPMPDCCRTLKQSRPSPRWRDVGSLRTAGSHIEDIYDILPPEGVTSVASPSSAELL